MVVLNASFRRRLSITILLLCLKLSHLQECLIHSKGYFSVCFYEAIVMAVLALEGISYLFAMTGFTCIPVSQALMPLSSPHVINLSILAYLGKHKNRKEVIMNFSLPISSTVLSRREVSGMTSFILLTTYITPEYLSKSMQSRSGYLKAT